MGGGAGASDMRLRREVCVRACVCAACTCARVCFG